MIDKIIPYSNYKPVYVQQYKQIHLNIEKAKIILIMLRHLKI